MCDSHPCKKCGNPIYGLREICIWCWVAEKYGIYVTFRREA